MTIIASGSNPKPSRPRRNIEAIEANIKAEATTLMKANISDISAAAVSSFLKMNFVPNRVLGASPPNISPLESLLPRSVHTPLAQLRSGHCRLLQACITSGISDVCPECGVAPHSIEHLFNCQSHLMQLTVGQPSCSCRLPPFLITKTSYDFSLDYLKFDHKSIVSSRPTGMIPYDLSDDYRKLITISNLRTS